MSATQTNIINKNTIDNKKCNCDKEDKSTNSQLQSWQKYINSEEFTNLNITEMKNILNITKSITKDIKRKLNVKYFKEEHNANPYSHLIESISTKHNEEDENYNDIWKIKMKFPAIRIYISIQYDNANCAFNDNNIPYNKIWLTSYGNKNEKLKIHDIFEINNTPTSNYDEDIKYFKKFVNALSGFLIGEDYPILKC
jgi:hypothetical protein